MTVEVRKVRVFEDEAGEYRWTGKDSNGDKVATSGEGYVRRSYAYQAARDLFPNAEFDPPEEEDEE